MNELITSEFNILRYYIVLKKKFLFDILNMNNSTEFPET